MWLRFDWFWLQALLWEKKKCLQDCVEKQALPEHSGCVQIGIYTS